MILLESSTSKELFMLADKIIVETDREPGATDRRLSELLFGTPNRRTQINGECRYMERGGRLIRRKRDDGLIGNYPVRPKPKLHVV